MHCFIDMQLFCSFFFSLSYFRFGFSFTISFPVVCACKILIITDKNHKVRTCVQEPLNNHEMHMCALSCSPFPSSVSFVCLVVSWADWITILFSIFCSVTSILSFGFIGTWSYWNHECENGFIFKCFILSVRRYMYFALMNPIYFSVSISFQSISSLLLFSLALFISFYRYLFSCFAKVDD